MASNSYRSSGSGRRPTQRLRIAQCVLVIVLLAVLFLVITMLSSKHSSSTASDDPETVAEQEAEQLENGKFGNGVSVNGIDISGMTAAEAREALASSVQSQKDSFSVTLTYGESQWVFDSSVVTLEDNLEDILSEAMNTESEEPVSYTTTLSADASAVESFVADIAAEVNKDSKNASMEYNAENDPPFNFIEGENGCEVNTETVVETLTGYLANGTSAATELSVTETEPSVTAASLKANTGRIARYSTTFSTKDKNRTENLKLACKILNGTVIKPGHTFSFNDVIGPRDEAHGWKEAHVIVNGSRYEDGWGGGICQVSTTLYNALLRTGADFSNFSRRNHSIPSSYVDKGLDATVSYGSKDFKFTNSSERSIYILASVSGTSTSEGTLTITLYGEPLPDGMKVKVYSEVVEELDPPDPELIVDETEPSSYKVTIQKAIKGYKVAVYREITIDGETTKEKLYTDTYKAVQGIYTVGGGGSSSSSSSSDSSDSSNSSDSGSSDEDIDIPEEEDIDIPEE